jgi:glycoside/pentoside/hexuronide:cation symporter, GPH family
MGTVGIATMFNATNILILRFMTDYLGIAAALAGAMVALSKLYDACFDPLIGGMSDRTRGAWGRRRPYLLVGAVLSGGVMVLLFNVPLFADKTTMAAYMALMLILYATGYAIFNVPYLAMPAEMTSDYHERSYLMSFRVIGLSIGQSVGGFLGPTLIARNGGGMRGHGVMGWILGGIVFLACFACFWMTRTAHFTARHEGPRPTVLRQFTLAWANRPFRMLMGAKLFQMMGGSVILSSMAFFTVHILHDSDLTLGLMSALSTVGIIVAVPLWVRFSHRHGKRATFATAVILYGAIMLTWLLSKQGEPPIFQYVRSLINGIGASGMLLMGASMLPDTIAYDRYRTGLRREGIFAGIYTTIEKLAFALGLGLTGVFLGAMGYVEGHSLQSFQQPPGAITAIYLCLGVFPAVLSFMSCLFLWQYDLTAEKLAALEPAIS